MPFSNDNNVLKKSNFANPNSHNYLFSKIITFRKSIHMKKVLIYRLLNAVALINKADNFTSFFLIIRSPF